MGEVEANRYRQHPLLADFAREQLGDGLEAHRAMAVYYQMFAQQYRTNYLALRPEWENMMAGMRAAHEQQAWPIILTYTATLTEAWFVRARYTQARQAYALARSAAIALADDRILATCLLKWGQACIEQTDYAEAEALLVDSMHIFKRAEDEAGIASVQYHLARIAVEQAQYDRAEALLISSQQRSKHLDDRIGVAAAICQQAQVSYRRGYFDKAKLLCEQALQMQVEIGDQAGSLFTLRLLADVALEQSDYQIADVYCRQALELCEKLENRGELAATYYSLTVVTRLQTRLDSAQTYAEKALELCQWTGDRGFQALTLYELSRIHALKNNLDLALEAGSKSMALMQALDDSFNLVYVLRHLGDLYRNIIQHEQARIFWQEAINIAKLRNHPLMNELQQRIELLEEANVA